MNKFKTFIILLISFILQTSVFSKLNILGANVNIFIPAIVAISIFLGEKIGGYSGLILGLVEDFLLTSFIGVRALSYYLIGYVVSARTSKPKKDKLSGFTYTLLASLFNFILVSLIYYILGKQASEIMTYLPLGLLIEGIINGLIYLIYRYILEKVMYIPTYRI
ncbi:MAG: rod shape-determining protein MreD [Anaerococcus sp.]|nr:rod shape-determining protein MreD [Anaerococcus sp.]